MSHKCVRFSHIDNFVSAVAGMLTVKEYISSIYLSFSRTKTVPPPTHTHFRGGCHVAQLQTIYGVYLLVPEVCEPSKSDTEIC